ncbi:MAG: hypothetical protein ILP14_03540 [Oscillospiraceae bacterium]|nr:hypothetical protein [Oscillospiraceae bacterium]
MMNKDDYEKEIKELITELAIEKQKQIANMKSELQVQTATLDIQYQNAMMQTQLSFRYNDLTM